MTARIEPAPLLEISIVGNSCAPAIVGVAAPHGLGKSAQPSCVPGATDALIDSSTRTRPELSLSTGVSVMFPYAAVRCGVAGPITAAAAICDCLNAPTHGDGPLEVDAEDWLEAHPAAKPNAQISQRRAFMAFPQACEREKRSKKTKGWENLLPAPVFRK